MSNLEEGLEEHFKRAKDAIESDTKIVKPFWIEKYKKEVSRNWDLFYKRNTTKFFKDRHWTDREFNELINHDESVKKVCLEVGCGVGNFVFPILEANPNLFIYACDFAPRAIDLVKAHAQYNEDRCKAFVCDLTTDDLSEHIAQESVDMVTALFVFSALAPEKMADAIRNIKQILRPGGLILFRDYGLYDAAQIRFSSASDHKLGENLYVRQDGTLSYFFSMEDLGSRFEQEGFKTLTNEYVFRKTVNKAKDLEVDRIFVQAKFSKP